MIETDLRISVLHKLEVPPKYGNRNHACHNKMRDRIFSFLPLFKRSLVRANPCLSASRAATRFVCKWVGGTQ